MPVAQIFARVFLALVAAKACLVGAAWHLDPKPAPALALVAAAAVAPAPVRAHGGPPVAGHASGRPSGPWSQTCGGCTLSGDYDGAPLTRMGSCATDCTTLLLSGKGITSLANDPFAGMDALVNLDLRENAISALPVGVFDALTSLEYLVLSNNAISALPAGVFDALTSLVILYLYSNSISALPTDVFNVLTSLRLLYLGGNTISALPVGVFDALTSLTHLYLRCPPGFTCPPETDNPALTCVPLYRETMASLDHYLGPADTCETPECAPGWTGPAGSCTQCPAGKFKAHIGTADCTNCTAGTYGSSPGSATCASCPTHSTTAEEGSDELTDCKCNAGFWGLDGGACEAE